MFTLHRAKKPPRESQHKKLGGWSTVVDRRFSETIQPHFAFSDQQGELFTVHADTLPGSYFGPPNLVELLRHRADHQAHDLAFSFMADGEEISDRVTYSQLDQQAQRIATQLRAMNLEGERALLLFHSGPEFVAAFFGCLYAGVVAVPVYPPRRNRNVIRVEAIAKDAQPGIALTTRLELDRVTAMVDDSSLLHKLRWVAIEDVIAGENVWQSPELHADTLAFLQYTSGSTGTPKGVMLSHGNLMHNSATIAYAFEHTRSGNGVFWLPLHHDMGLIGGILQPLYMGRPNTLFPPAVFLQKPLRWLQAITRQQATISGGPNSAYDLCVKRITEEDKRHLDLSSWSLAFNGAEPVRLETLDQFADAFACCGFRKEAFYPCYGLAEATLIVSGGLKKALPVVRTFDKEALERHQVDETLPDDDGARELVGCGSSLLDQEIVIADPDSKCRCAENHVGEIWVASPSVARGYHNRPELSAETFQARLADEPASGPYLRTGDLGFLSRDELFVTGRLKDLIIVRGVNYYPQDIEFTAETAHVDVRPSAGAAFTVGEAGNEGLVLVQEVMRRSDQNGHEICAAIRKAVAGEHEIAIARIVLVRMGSIPKTSSGKIQRRACRQQFLDGTLAEVARWPSGAATTREADGVVQSEAATRASSAPHRTNGAPPHPAQVTTPDGQLAAESAEAGATLEIIYDVVRSVARERAEELSLDTNILELGLDSLERVEIIAALEDRFGGRFPVHALPEMETCRQVVHAVEKYLGIADKGEGKSAANRVVPDACFCISEFPEYKQLQQSLHLAKAAGVANPYFTVHQGVTNDRTTIGGAEYINFCSYNYLGMSGEPRVIEAAQQAVAKYGTSVSASRLVSGEKPIHGELEQAIADWLGTEDSIVFVGGHSTNETTIGHLFGQGDLVLHDGLAHNSILQGCMLSGARRRMFPHNDYKALEELLEQLRGEYRRVLIAIEGVYSMDGDFPDLPKFIELKRKYNALLMVDEAHSIGTMGLHGRGISEHFDVNPRDVDIWMGTLSKSFGSCGGYIAGCKELVEYLKYTAPGFVYSVGLSPANAAAALASLRLLEEEPQRVEWLSQNSAHFLRLAKEAGLNTGSSGGTPVIPVITANSRTALLLSQRLFDQQVNVQPILYPAVEEAAARLRFFITCTHTAEQIRHAVSATAARLREIDPSCMLARSALKRPAAHTHDPMPAAAN